MEVLPYSYVHFMAEFRLSFAFAATDEDQCSTAFEYPQTILLVVAVVTSLAVIPTSLMSLLILLHRTVFGYAQQE